MTPEIISALIGGVVVLLGSLGLTQKSRMERKRILHELESLKNKETVELDGAELDNAAKTLKIHQEFILEPIKQSLHDCEERAKWFTQELARMENRYKGYEEKISTLEDRIKVLENDRDSLLKWAESLDEELRKTMPTLLSLGGEK